jgi:hypothetical protein
MHSNWATDIEVFGMAVAVIGWVVALTGMIILRKNGRQK